MAEDDRGKVLKGLGIKRRRPAGDAPQAEPAADAPQADASEAGEAPPEKKAIAGLGIKRRARPAEGEQKKKDGGGGGSGLGIKRRSGRQKAEAEPEPAEAEAKGKKKKKKKKVDKLKGKLGNDECAVLLRNHFLCRPDLVDLLPPRIWELKRTFGHYAGDGREERKIPIGWEPAFVLYTIPSYPDVQPTFTKDWKIQDPGPHRQPEFVEDGFVVDEDFNEIGEWYYYIVFRSDGKPLEAAPPAEEKQPEQTKKDKARSGLGLGIRRRR